MLKAELKRKKIFWARLLIFFIFVVASMLYDFSLPADSQVSNRICLATIRGYQTFAKPYIKNFVVCRFQPSCSEYSMQAFKKYGTARGILLTISRLAKCNQNTPAGTIDYP